MCHVHIAVIGSLKLVPYCCHVLGKRGEDTTLESFCILVTHSLAVALGISHNIFILLCF